MSSWNNNNYNWEGQQRPYYYANPEGDNRGNGYPNVPPSYGQNVSGDQNSSPGNSKKGKHDSNQQGYYPGNVAPNMNAPSGPAPSYYGGYQSQGPMYPNQQYGAPIAPGNPNFHNPPYPVPNAPPHEQKQDSKVKRDGILTGCLGMLAFCCCLDCIKVMLA